jgi:serine phosphatase RsbU (regulator of sigma subunit)
VGAGQDTTDPVVRPPRVEGLTVVGGMAVFAVLVVLGRVDYLAYHAVVEFLVAGVAFTVFSIAWNTRRLVDDDYLTVLGIGQLVVAGLTILHALTYQGMGIFPTATATTASQFWIVTRVLQAAGLVAAPAFIGRRLKRPWLVFAAFAAPAVIAASAVFAGLFPITFVDGRGLTPFKIGAEWVIIAGMLLGLWLLWRRRERVDRRVLADLTAAIGCMVAAELLFVGYLSVFDVVNFLGHLLHLASVYFIYQALVARSLKDPFSVLFRQLAQREVALRDENRFSEGLNRIGSSIGASLDSDEILNTAIVQAAEIAGADGGTVSVFDGPETLDVRYASGDPFESLLGIRLDRSQAPHLFAAAETGESVAIADTRTDLRGEPTRERTGTHSLVAIPLIARGRPTGVLCLYWLERSEEATSPRLLLFASKLGAALSLALANAQLYEDEHRVAETLQGAMLAAVETTADVEVGTVYRSAPGIGKIGGDFFDVFDLGNGTVAFVVGDVAGKGIEAAATNALTRSTFRALAYRNPDLPARVLAGVNEALLRQLQPAEFVTAVFGVLDPARGTVALCLAGHPEPVVCGGPEDAPDDAVRNPPLAVVDGQVFELWRFTVTAPEALVAFSDGIVEARHGGELFGIDRVRGVLRSCADGTCQEIADSLLAAVEEFSDGDLRDDIAILALRPLRLPS